MPVDPVGGLTAALRHRSIGCMTTITMTKRGSITLPPDVRKHLGLDRMNHPLLIVEERDGGVFLQPATAIPVRDIPENMVRDWIKADEEEMDALRKNRAS